MARKSRLSFFGLECQRICGLKLRRPHFSCLFKCRVRRSTVVFRRGDLIFVNHPEGTLWMPDGSRLWVCTVKNGRPVWKGILGKWCASLLEWLLN